MPAKRKTAVVGKKAATQDKGAPKKKTSRKKKAAAKKKAPKKIAQTTLVKSTQPNGARIKSGYPAIDPDALLRVRDKDFERLCWGTISAELSDRHSAAVLDGPARRYVADGGADLVLHVTASPRIAATTAVHALTPDSIGDHLFSAKTGDNAKNVSKNVVDDARKQQKPIDFLKRGGTYTVLISVAPTDNERKALHKAIVSAIVERSDLTAACGSRIQIWDATHIHQHLAHYRPLLPDDVLAALGIRGAEGLETLDEWKRRLSDERPDPPEMVFDKQRTDAIAEIRTSIASQGADEPLWVRGPPGIGKSRLVIEALQESEAPLRVLAAPTAAHAEVALGAGLLEAFTDVCLVVDECAGEQTVGLKALFAAKKQNARARLILIGLPAQVAGAANVKELPLGPLDDRETRTLVAPIIEKAGALSKEAAAELTARVASLCKGFPWFCILVAKAVAGRAELLPPGSDEERAARLAVAGAMLPGETEEAWVARSGKLLRVVAAISLSDGLNWEEDPARTDAEDVSGIGIGDLTEQTQMLSRRGIVRLKPEFGLRYVAPGALARIALSVCLHRYRLREIVGARGREMRTRLVQTARKLELATADIDAIAEADLQQVARGPPGVRGLAAVVGVPLVELARLLPEQTAHLLRARVEESTIDELRAERSIRRDLVWALEHITRRKRGFEDAERALFKLALAENESYGNNARGVWVSLFAVSLSLTHRSLEDRLRILEGRLRSPNLDERLLAVAGLETAVEYDHAGPGYSSDDMIDGEWPRPRTVAEQIGGHKLAWDRMVRLTNDEFSEVAHAARKVIIENVRFATRWSNGAALVALRDLAPNWSVDEKAKLRDGLLNVRDFERATLERSETARGAVNQLFDSVAALSLHDRLLDQVGRWPHHRLQDMRADGTLSDDADLAKYALEHINELASELPWLDSPDAQRSPAFMRSLGTVDSALLLLPFLISHVENTRLVDAIASYLSGVRLARGDAAVDEILRSWRGRPELALATAVTAWKTAPNEGRIGWIVEDLGARRLKVSDLWCFRLGNWSRPAPSAVIPFVEALVATNEADGRWVAASLALDISKSDPSLDGAVLPMIASCMEQLSPPERNTDRRFLWHEIAKHLLGHGVWQAPFNTALRTIRSAEHYASHDEEWSVVAAALRASPTAAWPPIGELLLLKGGEGYRIILEVGHHRLSQIVPVDLIDAWVRKSEQRGIVVAQTLSAYEAPLNEHARRLLSRFGPRSDVADVLKSRAQSTPHAMSDLAHFYAEQARNAREWAKDPDPSVAAWGQEMVQTLEREVERQEARKELRARR